MRYTTEWYQTDPRIDVIAQFVDSPRRILDFGALSTATAHKLVDRFPADVLVVDDTISTPSSDRIHVIGERMTPAGIKKLGRFDVTLALSVLHHLTRWRQYLAALQHSAPLLFVETAHPSEDLPKAKAHKRTPEMIAHLETIGKPIGLTEGYDSRFRRTLWLVQSS